MDSYIKRRLKKVPARVYSPRRLTKSISKIKNREQFRRDNLGRYPVILCGDHKGRIMNKKKMCEIQDLIEKKGVSCKTGEYYIKKAGRARKKEITEACLNDADLIILIDGKGKGTREESSLIRNKKWFKKKTLFFFRYKSLNKIANVIHKNQEFVSEFKYPIPYKSYEELKALILFGVQHWILYRINKKMDKPKKKTKKR